MGNLTKRLLAHTTKVLIAHVAIRKANIKVLTILNYLEFDKILGTV